MPLINVKLIEGVFNSEQKNQMIERLTDAMVSIEGENMRQVTWCVVEEVKSGDWGIGGNALTTEQVHALAQRGILRDPLSDHWEQLIIAVTAPELQPGK